MNTIVLHLSALSYAQSIKERIQYYPRREAIVGCRALLLLCCVVYTSTQVQGSQTDFVGDPPNEIRLEGTENISFAHSFLAD
jgi:hypothetical protein